MQFCEIASLLFFHIEEPILKFQPKLNCWLTAAQIQKPLCLAASSLNRLNLYNLYTCSVHSENGKDPLMFDSKGMPRASALTLQITKKCS